MVPSVRSAAELRSMPARGGSSARDADPAVVMSGPFTEDVRGNPWRPQTREPAEQLSDRCPGCRDEECWHGRPNNRPPDADAERPEPGEAEPPT